MLNWQEFDLFYHIPNYNITSKIYHNEKITRICPFKIDKLENINKNSSIYFHYIWCDLLVTIINNKIFQKNVKNYINHYDINNKQYTVFYIYHKIFNKMLIVNNIIKRQVNRFLNSIKIKSFIGIQIRVGNDELHERQILGERDVKIMVNIAKRFKKYKIWYLTGDSIKYKLALCKEYKNIIVYSYNKTKHYDKFRKDFTIIIEHEILSKASFLIVSKSTYGKTALLKSGLAITNLSNIIINGKINDVKKEYFGNNQ